MPLLPPAQPVSHPQDLVIDQFGTFLGKRSERLIIRWRDLIPSPSRDNFTPVSSSPPHPSPTPHAEPLSHNADTGQTPTPLSPTNHTPLPPQQPRPSTSTVPIPAEQQPHPATQITRQLLQLWGQNAAAQIAPQSPPASTLQLHLDQLGAAPGTPDTGYWRQRDVPLSRLRSVTIAGNGITLSSDLIAALVERGIGLCFLSGRGSPVAQVSAPGLSGTVQTRRSQLSACDTPLGVELAVEFVRGKLRNQKHQLQYSGKYLKSADPQRFASLLKKIKALGALRNQLADFCGDTLDRVRDKLMGYEGTGARIYWEGVSLILQGRADFPGRSTRGAGDPINSALNYGYGILYSKVSSAIINAGLEMYAGFLHVDKPGKPALVLDLVEEFRAPVVDRVVLAIVNQGIALNTDAHGLSPAARKLVAARILDRLSTPVPYEGKRWPIGTIIQNQARHLAVAVRGERKYRAFASRW